MKRNLLIVVLASGLALPACSQIQALKTVASLAIPNAGLEEIRGEVLELVAKVNDDVESLQIITAGYPLLQDSVEVMKSRASNCGITLEVQFGTRPQLSETGYAATPFDDDKYQSLGKAKKMAYLAKTHKALRKEHEEYSALISAADKKIKEILDFFEQTDSQIKLAELRVGSRKAAVEGLSNDSRLVIEKMKRNVLNR